MLCCSSVFLCEAEMFVYETLDPTILESSISYTWIIFPVALMGLKCGFIIDDVMFWLNHFGSLQLVLFWVIFRSFAEDRNVLWFTWRYFMIARWELMEFCYLSLIRILRFSLMPSVANRELLWSWLSFDIAHGDFDFVTVDLLLVISLQSLV